MATRFADPAERLLFSRVRRMVSLWLLATSLSLFVFTACGLGPGGSDAIPPAPSPSSQFSTRSPESEAQKSSRDDSTDQSHSNLVVSEKLQREMLLVAEKAMEVLNAPGQGYQTTEAADGAVFLQRAEVRSESQRVLDASIVYDQARRELLIKAGSSGVAGQESAFSFGVKLTKEAAKDFPPRKLDPDRTWSVLTQQSRWSLWVASGWASMDTQQGGDPIPRGTQFQIFTGHSSQNKSPGIEIQTATPGGPTGEPKEFRPGAPGYDEATNIALKITAEVRESLSGI